MPGWKGVPSLPKTAAAVVIEWTLPIGDLFDREDSNLRVAQRFER
jgi:hypothetical protein